MLKKSIYWLATLFVVVMLHAQTNDPTMWSPVKDEAQIKSVGTRYIVPDAYRVLKLDVTAMRKALNGAPLRFSENYEQLAVTLRLPLPDGSVGEFKVVESPVMPDDLAAQFPQIRTYSGWGISDPHARLKLDVTPQGFHAMVRTADYKSFLIDPYQSNDADNYIVYYRKDHTQKWGGNDFECGVDASIHNKLEVEPDWNSTAIDTKAGDCQLRTFRLALACTGEYATFHGSTTAGALAAMNTTLNRVNGVYEQDLGLTCVLVSNNTSIIYLNSSTDPYTNGNGSAMLGENQTTCDGVIGSANYDIGHVFSTGGGGVAYLDSPCSNIKAGGVTGSGSPVGDTFDIDYVAHEMGHQFGANHTQNNNCNSVSTTNMEPGSASTIMGYAGICDPDVQSNSDDYYHAISLQEIANAMANGDAGTCPIVSSNGNAAPTVNAGSDYVIPKSTPFVLTAVGSDGDGDAITYCWEQMNTGAATMPPVSTNTTGPAFRSLDPTAAPMRYFPNLTDLLNNVTPTWEVLPSVARTMNFRVTIRDNHDGLGCTEEDDMVLTVNGTAGPFLVTAPNTALSWAVGTTQTVTWDVAGTAAAPVSCANVDILLSTDGGLTYPITLATNVANDGSQDITVPNNPSTTCRVIVRCSSNIFFDISNTNFTITAPTGPDFSLSATPTSQTICDSGAASYTVAVNAVGGFSSNVTFSATGVPSGTTTSFSPASSSSSSTLTLNVSNTTAAGSYTITITGTSGALTHTATVTLVVVASPTATTLSSPADGATAISTNAPLSWSTVSNATSYNVQVATDAAFSNIIVNQSGITTTNYTATGLSVLTTYYWRVTAVNDCGQATSAVFSFTTQDTPPVTYCTVTGNTQDEYIQSIVFSDLTNDSGDNGGYADFTNFVANVEQGQTVSYTLTPGFVGQIYNEYWRISVDWNGDGDFTDAGEAIFTATTATSDPVTGTYTVPTNVTPKTTRMRIKMAYYQNNLPSCTNAQYGEIEDYSITISAPVVCESAVNIATPNYTSASGTIVRESSDYISATNSVLSGATATYSAATYVDMLPSFLAESGCDFTAMIQGCTAKPSVAMEKTEDAIAGATQSLRGRLSLLPNPAASQVNIQWLGNDQQQINITLWDVQGKMLQQVWNGNGNANVSLDVRDLAAGLYLVRITDASGNYQVHKLVIQH